LTFTGISNGVLALRVYVWGSALGYNGGRAAYVVGKSNTDTALSVDLTAAPVASLLLVHGSTASSALTGGSYQLSGIAMIPFTDGYLALGQQMYNNILIYGSGQSRSTHIDLNSVIGNAQVFDVTGTTLQTGVTIAAQSGFDYTQDNTIPEPGSMVLVAMGAAALWARRTEGRKSR